MDFRVDPSLSKPKRVVGWVRGRTQSGWGVGFVSGSKGVWIPSCPDPRGFRFGSFQVQTQYGLGWRVGLDPRGFEFGSFPVRTPN